MRKDKITKSQNHLIDQSFVAQISKFITAEYCNIQSCKKGVKLPNDIS